jgi:hypothetical protein
MNVNEQDLNKTLMVSTAVLAGIAGLGAVGVLIYAATAFTVGILIVFVLLSLCTIASAMASSFYGARVSDGRGGYSLFTKAEQQLLGWRDRRTLKIKRGELLMRTQLINIQQESENLDHKLMLDASDPNKPPYETTLSFVEDVPKVEAPRRSRECEHGYAKGDCHYSGCAHY